MSRETEEKVNQMARKTGAWLAQKGAEMIQSAFKTNPQEYSATQVNQFLKGLGLKSVSTADTRYWVEDLVKWKQIINIDWTDAKKYILHRYDCDNFAAMFSARSAEIFGLNSSGEAWGVMDSNDESVGHVFTVILVKDFLGALSLYILEPQTDEFIKFEKGQPVILGGRSYILNWILLR